MNVVCVCVEPVDPPCAMRFPLLHHTSSSRCLRLRLCRSSSNRVDDILVHTPEHTYTTLLLLERRAREREEERASTSFLFPRQVGAPVGFLCWFCCLLLSEKAASLCFCSWPTYWTLSHMCDRVGYSKGGVGEVIRHDDNEQTVHKLVDLLLTFLYLLLSCLLGRIADVHALSVALRHSWITRGSHSIKHLWMNSGTKLGGHAINLSGFGSPFAGPKVSWPSLPSSWLALVKNYFKLTSAWAFQSASDYNALFCTVERGEEGSYLYTYVYNFLYVFARRTSLLHLSLRDKNAEDG